MTEGQPAREGETGRGEALRVEGVHKSFGNLEVLRGIDLAMAEHEVVCLIGASGSGKSTLLRCINGLEKPDHGIVSIDGDIVGAVRRRGRLVAATAREAARHRLSTGMVFQRFNLFSHHTALENVALAPQIVLRLPREQAETQARALLADVGLAHRMHARPAQLSGGEQQRVAIARALAMRPKAMLFDEPTSALDPELVGEVLNVMRDLARGGLTMVIVTHEIGFAREVADEIVMFDHGSIVEAGPARSLLDDPRHERTRSFLARLR